jgi:AcrR family transcriptional regulator
MNHVKDKRQAILDATLNDKQKQLIEASIDLFAKEGFWNTPTSRIAKHAGVGTGTLFTYFESKAVLIDAVYAQLKQEFMSYVIADYPEDGSAKAKFEHLWFRYVDWGIRNPVRHDLLIQLRLSDLVSKEAQHRQEEELSAAAELVDQAVQEDLLIDIPIIYLAEIFQSQLDAAIRYATGNELTDMERTRHIALGFEVFWNGVTK